MELYEENETMQMLGQQISMLDDTRRKQIFDVLNAHSKHDEYGLIQMSVDIFNLGYYYGKKDRRKKNVSAE